MYAYDVARFGEILAVGVIDGDARRPIVNEDVPCAFGRDRSLDFNRFADLRRFVHFGDRQGRRRRDTRQNEHEKKSKPIHLVGYCLTSCVRLQFPRVVHFGVSAPC